MKLKTKKQIILINIALLVILVVGWFIQLKLHFTTDFYYIICGITLVCSCVSMIVMYKDTYKNAVNVQKTTKFFNELKKENDDLKKKNTKLSKEISNKRNTIDVVEADDEITVDVDINGKPIFV